MPLQMVIRSSGKCRDEVFTFESSIYCGLQMLETRQAYGGLVSALDFKLFVAAQIPLRASQQCSILTAALRFYLLQVADGHLSSTLSVICPVNSFRNGDAFAINVLFFLMLGKSECMMALLWTSPAYDRHCVWPEGLYLTLSESEGVHMLGGLLDSCCRDKYLATIDLKFKSHLGVSKCVSPAIFKTLFDNLSPID